MPSPLPPATERIISSDLGHLLFVINLCLFIHLYAQSGISSHEHVDCMPASEVLDATACLLYIPAWIVAFVLVNLPGMVAGMILTAPLDELFPYLCRYRDR